MFINLNSNWKSAQDFGMEETNSKEGSGVKWKARHKHT